MRFYRLLMVLAGLIGALVLWTVLDPAYAGRLDGRHALMVALVVVYLLLMLAPERKDGPR